MIGRTIAARSLSPCIREGEGAFEEQKGPLLSPVQPLTSWQTANPFFTRAREIRRSLFLACSQRTVATAVVSLSDCVSPISYWRGTVHSHTFYFASSLGLPRHGQFLNFLSSTHIMPSPSPYRTRNPFPFHVAPRFRIHSGETTGVQIPTMIFRALSCPDLVANRMTSSTHIINLLKVLH